MERKEIYSKLNAIFEDVLDIEYVHLEEKTKSDEVDGWDSLTHVHLCVEIQNELNIRFTAAEMQGWKNVGEMVNTIEKKLNNKK